MNKYKVLITVFCFCFLINSVFAGIKTATGLHRVSNTGVIEKEGILDQEFISTKSEQNILQFLTTHKNNLRSINNTLYAITLAIWVRQGNKYLLYFNKKSDMRRGEFIANNLTIKNACYGKMSRFYTCSLLLDNMFFIADKDYYIRLYDVQGKNNFVFDVCPAGYEFDNWVCTIVPTVVIVNDQSQQKICNLNDDDFWDSSCNTWDVCLNNKCVKSTTVPRACVFWGQGPSSSGTCSLNVHLPVSTACVKNFTTRTYKKIIWPDNINSYGFSVSGKRVFGFISTWQRTWWEIHQWKSNGCSIDQLNKKLTCDRTSIETTSSGTFTTNNVILGDEVYLSVIGLCGTSANNVEENLDKKYTDININYNAEYLRE